MKRLRIVGLLGMLVVGTACSAEWVNNPADPTSHLSVSPLGPATNG